METGGARGCARVVSLLLLAAGCGLPAAAGSQSYPNKPVRVVVAFAAGGFADGTTRQITRRLSERLGQTFVVDNRGGAGGNVGARIVAEATPDGYTILAHTAASSINVTLYSNLGFDLLKDFAPVANTVSVAGLFTAFSGMYENNLYLDTLYRFLDTEPAIVAPPKPRELPSTVDGHIEFENVSFSYPGADEPALDGVSFEIRPGETVAVVGEFDSGLPTPGIPDVGWSDVASLIGPAFAVALLVYPDSVLTARSLTASMLFLETRENANSLAT